MTLQNIAHRISCRTIRLPLQLAVNLRRDPITDTAFHSRIACSISEDIALGCTCGARDRSSKYRCFHPSSVDCATPKSPANSVMLLPVNNNSTALCRYSRL